MSVDMRDRRMAEMVRDCHLSHSRTVLMEMHKNISHKR